MASTLADAALDASCWFSRIGLPLDADERRHIGAVLGGLDLDDVTPVVVVTASELRRLLHDEDADNKWWDADEAERTKLWEVATERYTESALADGLSAALAPLDATMRAAAPRLAAVVAADRDLIARAIDAATLGVHHHALAKLAGAFDDHYFRAKYDLFKAGRWPLGIRGDSYYIL